jgi:hypothetical protein
MWVIGILASILFWPAMFFALALNPVVSRYSFREWTAGEIWSSYRVDKNAAKGQSIDGGEYDHDLRIVFALQLAAVLVVVALLTLLNAAGLD